MSEQTKIAVMGVSGRMGQMLLRAVDESDAATLIGASERPGHDWIGQDLGVAMGGAPRGVVVMDQPLDVLQNAHALLDFTTPEATMANAEIAAMRFRNLQVDNRVGRETDDSCAQQYQIGPGAVCHRR